MNRFQRYAEEQAFQLRAKAYLARIAMSYLGGAVSYKFHYTVTRRPRSLRLRNIRLDRPQS